MAVNQEVQAAKEMLLMATTADEQKMWVQQLSKKVKVLKTGNSQQQVTGYVYSLLLSLLICHLSLD